MSRPHDAESSRLYLEDFEVMRAECDKFKAPNAELLAALLSCISHGCMTGDEWVTDKALAAITKATGEGA